MDHRKAKPTYTDVAKEDICLYPKAGETLFVDQSELLCRPSSWRCQGVHQQQPAAQGSQNTTPQGAAAQDARPKSLKSSRGLSTFRREEQPQARAKLPASSPPSAPFTHH